MNKLPFDKINFLFLNNYYYHAPCLHFKEIEDIVNSLTEDDIDNDAFNWGYNCDMDRTPVRDSNIYPLISDNLQAFAEGIGLKIKAKIWEPWLNSYKKGQYQEIHDHAEHIFGAVVFINEGIDFAKFYFMDRQNSFSPYFIRLEVFFICPYISNVRKGKIYYLPSIRWVRYYFLVSC